MIKRLQLSEKLHAFFREHGYPENVYFQSPATVQMKYPCIRYSRDDIYTLAADNIGYLGMDRYTIIVIDPNPDSEIPNLLLKEFPYARFDRQYTADNLHHFSLSIYF